MKVISVISFWALSSGGVGQPSFDQFSLVPFPFFLIVGEKPKRQNLLKWGLQGGLQLKKKHGDNSL